MISLHTPRPLSLSTLALIGRDYDKTIAFFTETPRFTEEPRHEAYGTVVVLLKTYGNKWDWI